MADVDWGTEDNQAKPKKRVPTWVWITGGCCGVSVLGVIAMVVIGFVGARQLGNQPKNWEALGKYVQVDESYKDGAQITKIPMQLGHEGAWQIMSSPNEVLFVRVFTGSKASAMRKRLFVDQDDAAYQQIQVMSAKQIEIGTIEVQGRSLPRLRAVGHDESENDAAEKDGEPSPIDIAFAAFGAPVTLVDISSDGGDPFVLIHYSDVGEKQHIPDEQVVKVLEPFHIGPNR